ncbi:MAG: zinc dependent phospholipase C family protein [Clostridia bacterium]|nr:zinc dependent phospholipase C family protein [Clostridia bacterium]
MGSRVMHLAISSILYEKLPSRDKNRFLLGAILPDAAAEGNSHRKLVLPGGGKKTYDLTGFRGQYMELMKSDPLYLGFYLHLLQDLVFRRFVYVTHRWDPLPEGNVERLHNDYELCNRHIIQKYRLSPDIEIPSLIESEQLFSDCRYEIKGFLAELRSDFAREAKGDIFFFRREMADEYISLSVPICLAEMTAVQTGSGFADEIAMAWER